MIAQVARFQNATLQRGQPVFKTSKNISVDFFCSALVMIITINFNR